MVVDRIPYEGDFNPQGSQLRIGAANGGSLEPRMAVRASEVYHA